MFFARVNSYPRPNAPQDMIHIADTKVTRRYGEFFLRHIQKFSEITRNLDRARPAEVAPARKF